MEHNLSALFLPPRFERERCASKCPHLRSKYIMYSGEDTKIKKFSCSLYNTILSTAFDHSYISRHYKCVREFKYVLS